MRESTSGKPCSAGTYTSTSSRKCMAGWDEWQRIFRFSKSSSDILADVLNYPFDHSSALCKMKIFGSYDGTTTSQEDVIVPRLINMSEAEEDNSSALCKTNITQIFESCVTRTTTSEEDVVVQLPNNLAEAEDGNTSALCKTKITQIFGSCVTRTTTSEEDVVVQLPNNLAEAEDGNTSALCILTKITQIFGFCVTRTTTSEEDVVVQLPSNLAEAEDGNSSALCKMMICKSEEHTADANSSIVLEEVLNQFKNSSELYFNELQ